MSFRYEADANLKIRETMPAEKVTDAIRTLADSIMARFDFKAGDVAVLPAGTGHQRLIGSDDLLVVGGYPPQGTYNLCRGDNPAERDKALTTIPDAPMPDSDPVAGKDGGLVAVWRRT